MDLNVNVIDPGRTSALALYPSLRTFLFREIEAKWLSESNRAALLLPYIDADVLWVIEDGAGFRNQMTARAFERSQCKWYGALRLLNVEPAFVNVKTWHHCLDVYGVARRTDATRVESGLPKLPRDERVKAAVAQILKDLLGYLAPNDHEADALATAHAIHSGLKSGELAVENKGERRTIVSRTSTVHRSGTRGARKHSSRQRKLL